MKYLLLILISFSNIALADTAFMNYGLGVAESAIHSKAETKVISLGYREEMWDGIYWQNRVGYWGDGSSGMGRKSSGYAASGLGLEVDLKPVELRSGWSLATITSPDVYLGGVFPQFSGDFSIGVRDSHGNGMAITYFHISSAGLVTPNMGRDFVTLELSQKW